MTIYEKYEMLTNEEKEVVIREIEDLIAARSESRQPSSHQE